ncbi:MAG TPA: site-specific DNA-methyltransferase [Anaerovoracaceae bacterium]|nr:site-specific DNA-methyltransferase [Anaerovoracaceae bacterium]
MSLIAKLPDIVEESRKACQSVTAGSYSVSEKIGHGDNMLVHADNLPFMKYLLEEKGMAGAINLIYIDPPFFSKANYGTEIKLQSDKISKIPVIKQKAYHDVWEKGMEEYLRMLADRFFLMKELLAEDGCLWVHLDWHSVHYVKVLLDEIFGEKNFINEVIWNYKSGGVSKNYFARKHDTLLFYAKSPKYYFLAQQEKSYNRDFKPYRFKGVAEYRDELGWYTMVNMKDVWQINMVGRTSAERTGYATQKPEQLIERILESCTREGDLCADFFCGSGTLSAAANRLGRRWITCDIGELAAVNTHKRMVASSRDGYRFYTDSNHTENKGSLTVKTDLQPLPVSDKTKLTVTLMDYRPNSLHNIPVEEKYLSVIKKVVKEDSLQLVDYWSIDFDYDLDTYKPKQFFCKESEGIQLSCERLAKGFGNIGIRCIDIFGNSTFQVIDLRG